jgi:hypothetical protein
MEQRVTLLEDLIELITKQMVDQNKKLIETNINLLTEIRLLRDVYSKQDVNHTK